MRPESSDYNAAVLPVPRSPAARPLCAPVPGQAGKHVALGLSRRELGEPNARPRTRSIVGESGNHQAGARTLVAKVGRSPQMDHREVQLHQEIVHTRQAIDHKLWSLEWWVKQTVHRARGRAADIIERNLVSHIRWVQESRDRSVVVITRYPWLIVAGGMLLGYSLRHRGQTHRPYGTRGVLLCHEATPKSTPWASPRNSEANRGD